VALKTLADHADLFRIVSPIDVDAFESLLADHPNQPFVRSVVVGLREGFWPWADTQPGIYPETHDASDFPLKDDRERIFVRQQRDEEIALGRFSPSFGRELLPGMYSMPIHVVPKPDSQKLRLVVNHSMGEHSLNSMILRDSVAGSRLDTLKNLGDHLLALRRLHGADADLVLWKSDVSQAYRRLPMHPLWQLKQIVTIDGERHVDRCNSFGNRGSCRIWTSFMGLVVWISNKRKITPGFVYIDDNFSAMLGKVMTFYRRYERQFPTDQAELLQLWDILKVDHELAKQVFGRVLVIIGFEVDANAMTFTMPRAKLTELLAGVQEFTAVSSSKRLARHPLRRFMEIAGWVNWAFNVYPLLKPALSHLYEKISGKSNLKALVYVNHGIARDLDWFRGHVENSTGVHILESLDWDVHEADVEAFCDASLGGLGIYFPAIGLGYQSNLPAVTPPPGVIFYFEALCVCWCIHRVADLVRQNGSVQVRRIAIWTDSENTFHIFNSLCAKPGYNEILKSSVDVLIANKFQLRVLLIQGKKNIVADALSRWRNDIATANHSATYPGDTLLIDSHISPPEIPVYE
jgi:hypothetical protein